MKTNFNINNSRKQVLRKSNLINLKLALLALSFLLTSCSGLPTFFSRSPDGQIVYHKYYMGYETMYHGTPYPDSATYRETAVYDNTYDNHEKTLTEKYNSYNR